MQVLLSNALNIFFQVLYIIIFIRIILSWVSMGREIPGVSEAIYGLTDPFLVPVRKMIQASPINGGYMFDFTAIIVLFILNILNTALQGLIWLF
ncbi:MAG: YggT family protein [Firmicutes bacterium]|nr:YggT family protein [Bacillota bacterium]MBR0105132.1 YggT family protein [Bacillota bacterium]MBR2594582.1 YggT family protein [Bacillota bacterium]